MIFRDKAQMGIGPDSGLEPTVRAFRTVLLLAHRLRYAMDERLRADGLTTQQAALVTFVGAAAMPSISEAAAALGSTHQNVAQIVAALVRKDMLEVVPDPTDRRRKRLRTTGTSAAYWQGRDEGDFRAVADWFSGLTGDEVQTLCRLADRVLERLDP